MAWRGFLFLSFVLASFGCARAPVPGALCADPTQCASPLTCHFGVCRTTCAANSECGMGGTCLRDATGGGCALSTDTCDMTCGDGRACVMGRCVAACTTSAECPSDAHCESGACVAGAIDGGGIDAGATSDSAVVSDARADAR